MPFPKIKKINKAKRKQMLLALGSKYVNYAPKGEHPIRTARRIERGKIIGNNEVEMKPRKKALLTRAAERGAYLWLNNNANKYVERKLIAENNEIRKFNSRERAFKKKKK